MFYQSSLISLIVVLKSTSIKPALISVFIITNHSPALLSSCILHPSSTHTPCLHCCQSSFHSLLYSHLLCSPSLLLLTKLLFRVLNPIFIKLSLSNCFFHLFYFSPRPVLQLFGLSTLLVGGQGHVYHLVYKLRLAKGTSEKALCPHCLITLAFLHIKYLQPFMRMCVLSITSFTLTPTEKSNRSKINKFPLFQPH
jgi:hypothetical protein